MFLPVVLWTDALVFLLVLVVLLFAAHVRRHEHLAVPWKRVARSPVGMASGVVLGAFLLAGLLDSLHFRAAIDAKGAAPGAGKAARATAYSPEVRSLLDLLLAPIATRPERTYSAPLATHAYSRETVERAGGGQVREYPRLRHGGVHLRDPANDWGQDVLGRVLRGLALGLVAWLLACAVVGIASRPTPQVPVDAHLRDIWRGATDLPWRAMLLVLGVMLAIAFPVAMLAQGYHVLGTDKVGQDVLYLSLKSIRTALVIGTLTTLVMLPFAVLLGIMAGYLRSWVDDLVQYAYTTLNSIPSVLLIAASVLVLQVQMETRPELFQTAAERADFRLLFLCLILGVTSWTGLCRLLRGEALKLRELEYVQAAQAFGVGPWRIMTRHLLPNLMHIVLISVVMDFSGLVLAEAVLSYVGVGVDPSMISFGTMINAARLEMGREPMVWWSLASAFAFMFVLVLAANLFADAVRDAFDPRVRMARALAPTAPAMKGQAA